MHEKLVSSTDVDDSHKKIRKGFDHLKHEFHQKLNQLQENFVTQYEQYWDIKQKVDLESQQLEHIYRIKVSSEALKELEFSLSRKQEILEKEFQIKEEEYKKK